MSTHRHHSNLIAIIGRPNVGKSTLFNRIIGKRQNIVNDQAGITRDRIFARFEHNNRKFYLCDTGGFEPSSKDNIKMQLVAQAQIAIEEAACVLFVVDGRMGLHPIDAELLKRIRKAGKNFFVCVNKCDLPKDDLLAEEFRQLGLKDIFPLSAEHNRGIGAVLDAIYDTCSATIKQDSNRETIKIAIIGRPNVGKSSILNKLLGEDRVIIDDRPGTTRDAIDVELKYHARAITIIDTAGIRKKSRMIDKIENFSVLRSISCLEECNVAILVINAQEGATEGDIRVAGYAFEMRKAILIVVNKWDLITNKNTNSAKEFKEKLDIDLKYLRYAPIIFISALENLRVSKLIPQCLALYDQSNTRYSTSKVNNILKEALLKHTPPLLKNKSRRIKFYYATQVSVLPPKFVIFCSHPDDLHFSYKRYIENAFRTELNFTQIPISISFRERARQSLTELKANAKNKKMLSNYASYEDDEIYSPKLLLDTDENQFNVTELEFSDD